VNSGYRRGATVPRVEKVGDRQVVTRFRIFTPVALAGLGGLPDTTAERSITIPMQRKLISERTERFHIERTFAAASGLRRRCAAWAKRNADTLAASVPSLPAVLDDRAGECWGVPLTIAEGGGRGMGFAGRGRGGGVVRSGPRRHKGDRWSSAPK
jgi:hypothetical protein